MNTGKKLFLIFSIGFILRLVLLLFFWHEPLTIVDEMHYQAIAENILNHHEFSLKVGHPTSIRPPLYPAFLSLIYFLTGGIHINAVRIVQIILSLAIIFMVFLLGRNLFDKRVGLLASFIFAVYPSFLFFTNFLLTEVLFTLFLLLFVYFFLCCLNKFARPASRTKHDSSVAQSFHAPCFTSASWKRRNIKIFLTGMLLGLAALTRSVLYPFLILAPLYFAVVYPGSLVQKIKWSLLMIVASAIVIAPWACRNSLLHKSLVPVSTMGGLNMYMGNYKHTPLNRAWAAVDLTGHKAWYHGHEKTLSAMNEAQKQKWAVKKATQFILEHKGLTLKRDLIKAANFWGLERSVIGGIINEHWPILNKPYYLIGISLVIFATYTVVLIGAIFGIIFHHPFKRYDVNFMVILIGYFTVMHAIVFGHSRYHLPLVPLLIIFASWSFTNVKDIWRRKRTLHFKLSIISTIIFGCIWIREIVFVEGARYLSTFHF